MSRNATVFASLLLVTSALAGCDDASKAAGEKQASGKKAEGDEVGGGKASAEQADVEKAGAEKAGGESGAVLTLGAAKLFQKSKPDEALVLAADGKISMGGEQLGSFSADGKLTLKDGKVVLEAKADGSVLVEGQPSNLKLTATGSSMKIGDMNATISFAEDGTVAIAPSPTDDALALGHEGCSGELAKTCALALYSMLSGGGEASPAEAPSGAEAPPTAAPPTRAE